MRRAGSVVLGAILAAFISSPVFADVIINELDSDTASTDILEFVELYDGGAGNTPLDGLVVVFYNGSGDTSYAAFDLDTYTTDANGYFLMGNAAVVPTPDIIFADNFLQNGADAVALYTGNASDFPNGTLVTTTNLIDAIVYDTDDADDPGLLVLLNPGQPQINENGAGDKDFDSNQRCPNGAGGARNTQSYIQNDPTPDATNACAAPPTVFINELDADNGATDTLEFIELYDGGLGGTALDGVVVVFYDGSTDTSYAAFDLDTYTTDANGYFLLGNALVPGVDLVFADDSLEDGADAVAVYQASSIDFPNGTPVTTVNLIDAVVYGTDDPDDPELLVLLNPGQPQVNENGFGDQDNHSSQRCPNGSGGLLNTYTFIQDIPTPDAANTSTSPPGIIILNEVLADPPSDISGDANRDGTRDGSQDEFVEIINNSGGPLDISGWEIRDAVALRHVFPAGTVLVDQCGILVFGGGTPTGNFDCMLVQVASTGYLGYNNDGDTVKIVDTLGITRAIHVYGLEGGTDQSLTRDPDLSGPFVGHTGAGGSGGAPFSAGTMIDGTPFAGCGSPTDLLLTTDKIAVTAGDTVTFTTSCGLPFGPVGLFVVAVNGSPVFARVFISSFDLNGIFVVQGAVTESYGGIVADFQSYGIATWTKAGKSNMVSVTFN
ncbi:MAG: lamin tail domain-containing protein [Planctomycetota bacterium]